MGLLDRLSNFSTSINDRIANSLLPINNPNGLLDEGTAQAIQRQALLQGGASLLQNSGPSTTPRTFGQNVGQAVERGQQAQAGLTSQALQNQLIRANTNRANALSTSGATDPAAVREFQYFQQLSPEDQQKYLLVKRNQPGLTLERIPRPDGTSQIVFADQITGQLFDINGNPITGGVRSNPVQSSPRMEDTGVSSFAAPQASTDPSLGQERSPEAEAEAVTLAQQRAQNLADLESRARPAFSSAQAAIANLEMIQDQASQIRSHPGLPQATGFGGETISGIAGTPAADAAALILTLKAQTFANALQAMRDASQTGGAVGQVSDAEGARFESQWAAVQQAQSYRQYVSELQKLERVAQEAIGRIREAYELEFEGIESAPNFETGNEFAGFSIAK